MDEFTINHRSFKRGHQTVPTPLQLRGLQTWLHKDLASSLHDLLDMQDTELITSGIPSHEVLIRIRYGVDPVVACKSGRVPTISILPRLRLT